MKSALALHCRRSLCTATLRFLISCSAAQKSLVRYLQTSNIASKKCQETRLKVCVNFVMEGTFNEHIKRTPILSRIPIIYTVHYAIKELIALVASHSTAPSITYY